MKKGIKVFLVGSALISSIVCIFRKFKLKIDKDEELVDSPRYYRLECYYDIMTRWMELKMNHESIADHLKGQGIHKIGIYGHGKVGILLYQDLAETGIKVQYFLDEQAESDFESIDGILVTSPTRLPTMIDTDAIIVTPSFAFDEIESVLKKKGYDKLILSLSHLLYQV